jgi:xanthine dehydrogenase large subunit
VLRYSPAGALWSDSPTTYKIPNVTDVPADFRVAFLDNPDNTENLYASKAVGEPPLLLAVSVWAAVKQALAAVGVPLGRLNIPACNEEILLALTSIQTPPAEDPAAARAEIRNGNHVSKVATPSALGVPE